jgi:excisionase family DNA binding protein
MAGMTQTRMPGNLTPADIALMFRIGNRTVVRWADNGKLGTVDRTAGGQRRFRAEELEQIYPGCMERLAAAINVTPAARNPR